MFRKCSFLGNIVDISNSDDRVVDVEACASIPGHRDVAGEQEATERHGLRAEATDQSPVEHPDAFSADPKPELPTREMLGVVERSGWFNRGRGCQCIWVRIGRGSSRRVLGDGLHR